MKKRLIAIIFATLIVASASAFTAFAETTPMDSEPALEEVTEDVFATEEPYYTESTDIETEPYSETVSYEETTAYYEDPTATYTTDSTDSTDSTNSTDTSATGSTETTTVASTTVAATTVPATRPTEPIETETYSNYESPAPVYTPADQDFEVNDWQEIKLDLNAPPSNGKGSFDFIQQNNTKGNSSITYFLVIGIVLIFLSLAGFTFVALYNPNKKAHAKAGRNNNRSSSSSRSRSTSSSRNSRSSSSRTTRRPTRDEEEYTFNPDDYNDGF